MSVVDEKGLRLAREVRAAIRRREEDQDLQAAIEVYDRAVTSVERVTAAGHLLVHTTEADRRYQQETVIAFLRVCAPELLPPELRAE